VPVWFRQLFTQPLPECIVQKEPSKAGICDKCVWAERVNSTKGSTYILCGKSRDDKSFPKYPRLPVLNCRGFTEIAGRKKA
jgi:hypothetical protein